MNSLQNNENVQVEIDDRRDECILTIKNVRKEHEGVWECVAYEGRDEVGISKRYRTVSNVHNGPSMIAQGKTPWKDPQSF